MKSLKSLYKWRKNKNGCLPEKTFADIISLFATVTPEADSLIFQLSFIPVTGYHNSTL